MIIDCISDLHGHYPQLEKGDLLIVAGDLTGRDTLQEYLKFNEWLTDQNYKRKIVISGNHDNLCHKGAPIETGYALIMGVPVLADKTVYLCDSGTEFEGLKIWGSPWTKKFPGMNPACMAFTVDSDEELAEKWKLIPEDTDILVTHCPMGSMLDETTWGENVGSPSLFQWFLNRRNKQLKLHVHGHIHECYGEMEHHGIIHVNASHVNENYEPVNKPIRVIL